MNFTPFPTIETEHLLLRRITLDDTNDMFEMRKDPSMYEYLDTKVDKNPGETKAYISKMNHGIDEEKWIIWAIEHIQSNKVIGTICIWNLNEEEESGELGYGIIPDYQGQGLMKESLVSVIEYGFEVMKLKVLEAYTEENNEKSINLLETCEFVEVNRVDEAGDSTNRVYRMVVFRLLAE
ncbi:GNAT family N-acetyltransferase [Paenisporosarcina macmurdoensis]|uniref:GNAT family N-acetyltransferase n=1 Tax=Paenisporosarcina macmurdoensis TaxID=212659 RepID=A0ABW1LAV2_9BACL